MPQNYKRLFSSYDMIRQELSIYSQSIEQNQYNKKKRGQLDQLIQILEHLRYSGDNIISSIARFTNMSHCAATRNCEKLIKAGLVLRYHASNNRRYKLTSEGIFFLNNCRNFRDLLCKYQLSDTL
ncbi:MAG TPA: winged helix-turn-helix domain-containing protein [Nitrosopumilaceae archaeon]|nr:winged helix-turn-helix domain-containing protein [Nitrosopumilaceae archaeon]